MSIDGSPKKTQDIVLKIFIYTISSKTSPEIPFAENDGKAQ